jgi:excinuclease ABC subunit C
LRAYKKEMAAFSRSREFEKAATVRNQIMALENVMAHARVIARPDLAITNWPETEKMLKNILAVKSPISKIECYDISNIQGKNAVGSMVVFVDGAPDKSQYKKFSIRMKHEPNDIAMLQEVLARRMAHPEWGYPQAMLIDGGKAQLNVAIKTKNQFLLNSTAVENRRTIKNIKIISIAKGRQELFAEGRNQPIPLRQLPQPMYNLIKHLDDEAHRFAITYHKKVRKHAMGLPR